MVALHVRQCQHRTSLPLPGAGQRATMTFRCRWSSMWGDSLTGTHTPTMVLPCSRLEKACEMYWLLGALYVVLLITLGVLSLRKGHWVMFIIGIFIPLFWFIGALLPPK